MVTRAEIQSEVDVWHAKKNTRKNIEKFRRLAVPRILGAIRKLGAAFAAASKQLTHEHLFGTNGYIQRLMDHLEANHRSKHGTYADAAEMCEDEGAWQAARQDVGEMGEMVKTLAADKPAVAPVVPQVNPDADAAAVLAKIKVLRAAKNFKRDKTPIVKGQPGWRNEEITSLAEFRLKDTPDPLVDEMKAVVTLHRDYEDEWKKWTVRIFGNQFGALNCPP